MGGENVSGNGFPCWLIYFEFFEDSDVESFSYAEKKVASMFGVDLTKDEPPPVMVPKRMYLLFTAGGGTEMQERALASRFSSKEAAEGRVLYLCGENPESIGRLGVEEWNGK